ncbi:MAG: SagB/ThcOx family dehydrogenase [Polyangiaceae bacterium]|nr:SagB/ThcOx family dehydrogenase [Polyangiaceae bacterium]
MFKLAWVSLPIVIFAAAVAWFFLRRKPLSRVALNVWTSVLLLVYVAITAGLGVFWVARQQLPVFDWHYLFGYGTIVLLGVHLFFNARILIAYFGKKAKEGTSPERGSTKFSVGWFVAAAFGMLAAFFMGVRHGKIELTVEGGHSNDARFSTVQTYHDVSSHSRTRLFTQSPSVDWGDAPPPKVYTNVPRLSLTSLGEALSHRSVKEAAGGPASAQTAPLNLPTLASILHHTAGVTHGTPGNERFAAPSSGALFPAEVYVVPGGRSNVPAGVYHYHPPSQSLEEISGGRGEVDFGFNLPPLSTSHAVVAVTAVLRRTGQKYRDRAYRYAMADIGHLVENLILASAEHGLWATPLPMFDDAAAARALHVDGTEEVVAALVVLSAQPGGTLPLTDEYTFAAVPEKQPLGISNAIHTATSLVRLPKPAAERILPISAEIPLRLVERNVLSTLQAIERRESRRNYGPAPLSMTDLTIVAEAAVAPFPRLSSSLTTHVIINRVEGLSPGAYLVKKNPFALVPIRTGDLHDEAFSAALSQEVIGNAAALFVLAIDRTRVLAGGARGYRHAYLEVGMVGERVLLAATSLGMASCPVGAFFDEPAAALLGVSPDETWVAHFVAVGMPVEQPTQ